MILSQLVCQYLRIGQIDYLIALVPVAPGHRTPAVKFFLILIHPCICIRNDLGQIIASLCPAAAHCCPAYGIPLKILPEQLHLFLKYFLAPFPADDDKFIPSDSVEISSLKRLPHPPGTFHQDLISKCMASQIIDILQAVDIQIYDAHRGLRLSQVIRIGNIPVAVVEGGQGVMIAEPV